MAIEGGRQGPVWLLGLPAPLLEMQKERPIFFFLQCSVFIAVRAFSSCSEQGLCSSFGAGAFHCNGFSCCRTQVLGHCRLPVVATRAQAQ